MSDIDEGETNEQQLIRCLKMIKTDSAFFIDKAKKKNPLFDPEDEEQDVTELEREIRWHFNITKLSDCLISENIDLRRQLDKANHQAACDKADWISQKSVLTNEITSLTKSNELLTNQMVDLRDNLESLPTANSTVIQNIPAKSQSMKMKIPIFKGEQSERPMHFLQELKRLWS